MLLIFSLLTFGIQAQILNAKYDSRNHPKAKGVWVTVRYPRGWEPKEGERPNIVQKFSGDYKNIFVMLALQIIDIKEPIEKECADLSANSFSESIIDKDTNQKITKIVKTKHEEKPAFIYETQQSIERAGLSTIISQKTMTVCYRSKLINVLCAPTLIDTKSQKIISTSNEIKEVEPLCFQFFNSLVLMEKY